MATKVSTVYSTNPKMDTSGVSAQKPVYGYMGQQIGTKPVAGGTFYQEAVYEQCDDYGFRKDNSLTDKARMQAAARFVDKGFSVDHAFDIVSKDNMAMPDPVDMMKRAVKSVKGNGKKGY